jgi:O-methyltransferase involved in polyketide biosynthesis
LRRSFFTEDEQYHFIEGSFLDTSWMSEIEDEKGSVLCIAEGLFMYFTEAEMKSFIASFADRFPGAEMLFEMLAPFLVGRGKHHETVKKIDSVVDFKWGLKDSREMTSWHPGIEFIQEWNYFDYHKNRWKWFGVLARMPFFRPRLANRIVHLRFGDRV